ncbi:MAG: plasmid replication protein, CyRepA1 family [Nostoc sp. DedSLP03]|uniref:plasmid replication protein, CyRepA1 family n=1 Tax=Nostoc sp. DedSLP03 TaxID=3075400 RepID=UPI002AD33403|nr:plasmid replication protein, CyRepA1 family [Nostoc sp. DedSLP03]MDZ7970383.1 plasmid replication protein, CyRepA1 family [Nostoc sp. DedSLP03]
MSAGYIPCRNANGCPICESNNGKCRAKLDGNKEFILCMTLQDARKGETVNGYKCIKSSDNAKQHQSATFVLDNSQEWTDEQRRDWELRKAQRQLQAEQEESRRRERALSPVERHELYSEILNSLSLDGDTLADLQRRGFSDEEIKDCGFKSVRKFQSLSKAYDERLPGIYKGRGLSIGDDSYCIPIRDYDGYTVAMQLRLHNPQDGNRYRWLSTTANATLQIYPEGENPLAVFKPKGRPQGIALAEGTGAKPFLVSQRLNLLTIGASGGQWLASPKLLKSYLERASAEVSTDRVTLYPDGGDVANESVMNRWRKLAELLADWGYIVKFGWWGQASKEDSDIDELSDFSNISYLTPKYFWSIAEEHTKVIDDSEKLTNDWAWQQWLRSREFTPDIEINQPLFRFANVPNSDVILAALSGLGTGKTEALLELIKTSPRASMIIGYRNNLLFQTIQRGQDKQVKIYHLREDDGFTLVADESTNQGFCLDSIHRVDGYFEGRDIYLDETCSVLLHAANGGTLGENQARAIKILSHALNVCNRVILLDGNLSDIWVDFIAKLAPNKRVIKILNKQKIVPHNIKLVDGIDIDGEIKKRDKSALLSLLCSNSVIPWIASDSATLTKVIDGILKKYGKVGFCLNAETAGEEWAKEFLANPNKFIETRKPQYFIISPSAESGVSVTINNYFTDKFTFFVGVQGTNSQHQMMFRLRDNLIPHYVFCPQRSMVRDRSTPGSYSAKQIEKTIIDRVLMSADLLCQDAPTKVAEIIYRAMAKDNDDWFAFSCKLGALDKFEMDNLRDCLIHSLSEAGNNVEVIQWETIQDFKELEKEVKEQIKREHSKELFEVQEYDSVDEAKQISKTTPGKLEQRRIEKTLLLDRIPGIKDSEIWSDDFIYNCHIKDRDFITKQQRFYLLNNFPISQKRHEADWFYKATKEDFFLASIKKISHLTIWALQQLNISQFLDGREYHKDSLEVLKLIQKARSQDIAIALGIQPSPDSFEGKERTVFIANLLAMIGVKTKSQGRKLVDGVRQRCYAVDVEAMASPQRIAVLEAVERKFKLWMEEKAPQINWEESSPENEVARALLDAVRWEDILTFSQDQINEGWKLLDCQQDARLRYLHKQYLNQLQPVA